MTKCSIIICYNKRDMIDKALSYIQQQTIFEEIEVIALDNANGRFPSAAKALNYGAERAKGEVLIIMHQDIYLWQLDTVEKYYEYLKDKDNIIAGVAGCVKNDGEVYYDIYETKQKIRRAKPCNGEIMEAYSLDECFFAMNKKLWLKIRFDELTCDNWHLYAVDICYSNALDGGKNVILPAEICHDSMGNAYTRSFEKTVKNLLKKYKGSIKKIEAPCVHIDVNSRAYCKYILKNRIKFVLRKIGLYKY